MLQDASTVFIATTIQTVGNSYGENQNCTWTSLKATLLTAIHTAEMQSTENNEQLVLF